MANCNFTIEFTNPSEALIERARKEIIQTGGIFNGTTANGSFEIPTVLGRVKGSYNIQNQVIEMNITRKPFGVGCSRIERELREQLGQ